MRVKEFMEDFPERVYRNRDRLAWSWGGNCPHVLPVFGCLGICGREMVDFSPEML